MTAQETVLIFKQTEQVAENAETPVNQEKYVLRENADYPARKVWKIAVVIVLIFRLIELIAENVAEFVSLEWSALQENVY